MDPYGFSLENFDVIGRWRDADSGTAIDARRRPGQRSELHRPSRA